MRIPLAALAERAPLAPDQDFRAVEIGRDAASEPSRRGDPQLPSGRTATTATICSCWSCAATARCGSATQALPVGEGSLLYVPRGAVHAFANQSGAPSVAYAIYTPPFDGKDRIDAIDEP